MSTVPPAAPLIPAPDPPPDGVILMFGFCFSYAGAQILKRGWSKVLPASDSETFAVGGVSKLANVGVPETAADEVVVAALEDVVDDALALPQAASVSPTTPARAARDACLLVLGIWPILLGFRLYRCLLKVLSHAPGDILLRLGLGSVLEDFPRRAVFFELPLKEKGSVVGDSSCLGQIVGDHYKCDGRRKIHNQLLDSLDRRWI